MSNIRRYCDIHRLQHFDRLVVDHDHGSNRVRGLLCQPCNVMLGKAEDRPWVLQAGAEYLQTRL